MNKCPRCENENLKDGQNFCQICGLDLKREERVEVISVLKLIESFFENIEDNDPDIEKWKSICVESLKYAIDELEKTAQEVPVQEQYVTLKIDSKEIAKVVIDEIREQQKHYNITLIPV